MGHPSDANAVIVLNRVGCVPPLVLHFVPINLWQHFREKPLARIHTQTGALNVLAIKSPSLFALAFALHPIVCAIIGDFKRLFCEAVIANFACARVFRCEWMRGKGFMPIKGRYLAVGKRMGSLG